MPKLRFHLLGLVHLPTSRTYNSCAFTQKNYKLAKMLTELGHDVFVYGSEGSDVPCTEFIETHTLKDIRDTWGDGNNLFEIGYDWHNGQFRHDINEAKKPVTLKYYENAIKEINKRKQDSDILLITQGSYQKTIADAVGLYLTVESGIGYRGSYCKFRSFESTYIQNFTYGSENPRQSIDGKFYDRVIPNYFEEEDFQFNNDPHDYFLYMGRIIHRKGVNIAVKAALATGNKLYIAGQTSNEIDINKITQYPNIKYLGYADINQRSDIMRNAVATFTPSIYLEPFCGVHAESMLCGTPVITTNFGAFTDYVIDGVNGYKCDTLQDFADATVDVKNLDRKKVRESAEQFTLKEVSKKYEKWFQELNRVYLSTKDPKIKAWNYINSI